MKYGTRKLSYHKDDRAMRPVNECPKNFPKSLTMLTAILFPKFLMGFLPTDALNMRTNFEARS